VWSRDVAGLRLTFYLAGINNQNFLMRDRETGTYWQQISGLAVSGPLKGQQLTLVPSDELTLATWKAEEPEGTVLNEVAEYASQYAPKDWDLKMKTRPVVLSFPESGVAARELMLGIQAYGASRAFPFDDVIKEKLIKDHVGGQPVLLVVGPDDQSVRVFVDRIPGIEGAPDFYRLVGGTTGALLMDEATGSEWNFKGCAIAGKARGTCLEQIPVVKDYWFDWRNYNPKTTIYGNQR
jgi:hypothetical protein